MSKRKSERNARRNARKKAQQSTSKAILAQSPGTSKTNDAKATFVNVSKPSVAFSRRFKVKRLLAVVTLLCLVATSIFGYRMANEEKQTNDRAAGRLGARTEIVELIPALKSAEMKPLVKPMHPYIRGCQITPKQEWHDICARR